MLWNNFTKQDNKIIGDAITVSLRNQASLPDGKYTLLDLIQAARRHDDRERDDGHQKAWCNSQAKKGGG